MIHLLGVNRNRDHSLASERIYKLKAGLPTHLFFLVIIHCSILPPKSSSNAFRILAQERKDPWADLEDSSGSLIWFSQPASLNLLFLILKQELNSLNWCGNYLGDRGRNFSYEEINHKTGCISPQELEQKWEASGTRARPLLLLAGNKMVCKLPFT